jgi:uncharacterized protein YwqG
MSIAARSEEIRRRMARRGLERVASKIEELLKPSIRLRVGKPSKEPVTRLGGAPNLPVEFEWPARNDGQPHSFLAQIDLAKLEAFDGLPLPNSGSLFFFCDAVYIPSGYDPGDNDGCKVIHCAAPLSDTEIRNPPRGLDSEFIFKGFSLEPSPDLTGPSSSEWEIESLRLSDAESEAYSQLFAEDGSAHRIGGYPDVVQNEDMTLTAELVSHGINCGSPAGYKEGKSKGLGAGATDWRLLLQLDSEEDAGMMWGDVGKLFFLIREQDLKALTFDRVWVNVRSY